MPFGSHNFTTFQQLIIKTIQIPSFAVQNRIIKFKINTDEDSH